MYAVGLWHPGNTGATPGFHRQVSDRARDGAFGGCREHRTRGRRSGACDRACPVSPGPAPAAVIGA